MGIGRLGWRPSVTCLKMSQGESCSQLGLTWANGRLMIQLATLQRMHCTFNFQVMEFTKYTYSK